MSKLNVNNVPFFQLLLKVTAWPIVTIIAISLAYLLLMSSIDHKSLPFPLIISILAIGKTMLIAKTTLRQLSKMIDVCNSLNKLFWVFGIIIFISIFSFATDYNCLFQYDSSTFNGVINHSDTYLSSLFNFIYFSTITFSTVGYGDIEPITNVARLIVMLEIFISFLIIVFAVANIKNIHLNLKK